MGNKKNSIYICQTCTYESPKWLGKCPECEEWNSFVEEVKEKHKGAAKRAAYDPLGGSEANPRPLNEIQSENYDRIKTGVEEFDRVMGGGLIVGGLTLIGGEPGVGKSTLLMEIADKCAGLFGHEKVYYVSGEESESQLAQRAKRLGVNHTNILISHENIWQTILEHLKKIRPKFFILDSIQTTVSLELNSAPGTISQIREVTHEIMNYCKHQKITTFIIGHVTKEGNLAGPKVLEHMVDTVIYFEGDSQNQNRILRVVKNRFGNTNEIGIFEMSSEGLIEVPNPSQYFVNFSLKNAFGRSTTTIIEGSRCLFVEIQALVVNNKYGNGRRTTQGVDQNRLSMIIAVIEKYHRISLNFSDVYLNVVGGIKLLSRDSDLSIMASILSSIRAKPIENTTVFLGEVGLSGEVRPVPMMDIRIKEMAQLGYSKVITAKNKIKDLEKKSPLPIIGIERAEEVDKLLFS